jgi:branched-chain amino acid transport system substrate-binding protein
MTMRNRFWIFVVLVVALAAVPGCRRAPEEAAEAGEPYRIGAIFAVTGPASWLGEPEKRTALMLQEEINAGGGVNGRPIKVIVEDTEGDENKGLNAVNKLIVRDNVIAIIGPSRSGTSMAVIPITEEAKVPLVSCAAAQAIVAPEHRYTFQTPQQDRHAVRKIFGHMKSKGIEKVAIITGTTGFGKEGRKKLIDLADEYGIEIVADETYAPADTDMTAQLTKIRDTGPEAIVNWSIVPAQSIVMKNKKTLGMEMPLYQSHGFGNIKYVEAAGDAAEGVLFPAGRLLVCEQLPDDHPQKKLLVDYKTAYEAKFNEPVSTFGGHAYDALNMVVAALEEVGDDREGIRNALEQTTGFVGTGGIYNMSPEDHNGLNEDAFEMLTVRDGTFVLAEN